MKKLLLLLLIVGCGFANDEYPNFSDPKKQNVENERQCYQDGYLEGVKFSKDDAISFGLGMMPPIAPFAYVALGVLSPKPSNHLLENKVKICEDSFILGYTDGATKTRKSSLIKGFAFLWISLMISSGFIN